ncbi:hypothetical protein [Pedobacter sp. Bi27]|uniref:hypothetical protein n=1 Tax=Pedobacter sp. Bi27 TaxID=2822351 RepID=UPI001E2879AF|nr:hypothetical protein [Pedobacter sp. Bi27]
MAKTVFHFRGCWVQKPLFLNPTAAAASDSYRSYSEWRDWKPPRTTSQSFPKSTRFFYGAQGLYKTLSFFPFYAFTLRFLVPRCCRVTLRPGLNGKNSFSFSGLLGAETPVPKPDSSGSLRFLSELQRMAGLETSKNHKPTIS